MLHREGTLNTELQFQLEPNHSKFVTAVSWVFIAIGGLGTLISLMQALVFRVVLRNEEVQSLLHRIENAEQIPGIFLFMFNNIHLMILFSLLAAIVMLIVAIGLLKRKEWARIGFIVLMVLAIIWNLASLVLQFALFDDMFFLPHMAEIPNQEVLQVFQGIMLFGKIISALMVAAFSVLFGWIISKLVSPAIRKEFA